MDLRLLERDERGRPVRERLRRSRGESLSGEDAPLVCAACGAAITHRRNAIDVAGAHEHTFVNPAGIIFPIRCFRAAPGCRELGTFTEEFSWFPGFAWRYAFCAACREHLGWVYAAAAGGVFYGFIAEKLVGA
jgi:hypothetical protein